MEPIYLDIGNSSFKLAEYQNGNWTILCKEPVNRPEKVINFLQIKCENRELVISSVRKEVETKLTENLSDINIYSLHVSQVPSKLLNYNTPETLGIDRFLSCFGAASLSKKAVIVIDAGSACTIDYMTAERVFHGGVIMPGLRIFKKVMADALPELPEVDESLPANWPGKSTNECIRWGLYGGYASAVEAFIRKHQTGKAETEIYITGGDALLLKKLLNGRKELKHHEYLLFEGMREFNRFNNANL
ncbi:MAG: type III pantothenate kinase [Balneolaceae bacterium]|nr:type III pantothenate kinase [Balneolaceae bacterium]